MIRADVDTAADSGSGSLANANADAKASDRASAASSSGGTGTCVRTGSASSRIADRCAAGSSAAHSQGLAASRKRAAAKVLPLKKLIIHGNSIGADGYAALGAAIRHDRCRLEEFVATAQLKERKTGQNRVSKTEEHNVVAVSDIATLTELKIDFLADPEARAAAARAALKHVNPVLTPSVSLSMFLFTPM
eukprot:6191501-Pleurochrysis_carterae.AAC.6